MEYSRLFAALDAKPFRPFSLEIVSGRRIEVTHPDNIIWPDGLAALLFPGAEAAPG